jgi:uncharacterized caspase-like protein
LGSSVGALARIVLVGCLLLAAAPAPAQDRRVALVIGNSAYENANVLANPRNDADAMAATLDRLGFTVVKGIDVDNTGMKEVLRQFGKELSGARVGLFFYAGHGVQVDGNNYIIPVDAKLETEEDLAFEAVDVALVLKQLEREPRVNLVFLDACRDNPFAQKLARSMGLTRNLAIADGLARIDSGIGTLIAYATQPNYTADDGTGDHSPFTEALLNYIETPGLEVRQVLTRVRQNVLDATDNRQVPWDHSSLTGDFYFVPPTIAPTPTVEAPPAAAPSPDSEAEMAFWNSIQDSLSAAEFDAFLTRFPDGTFATLAKIRLAELRRIEEEDRLRETGETTAMLGTGAHRSLLEAAEQGDVGAVQAFLAAGADPNALDSGGKTALHAAALLSDPAVIEALLKAGADPNARDHEAATPLHIAARAGSAQVIAALLEAGADPNIPATAGRTALDIAYAEQRPAEVLFLLREHGGRCNWDC